MPLNPNHIVSLGDATNPYKRSTLYVIGVTVLMVGIPLTIKNYMASFYLTTVTFSLFMILLWTQFIIPRSGEQKPAIHYLVVTALIVVTALSTIYDEGSIALFWLYPIVVGMVFLLPLAMGIGFSCFLVVAATVLVFYVVSFSFSLRVLGSLTITLLMSIAMLRAIHQMQQQLVDSSIKDPLTGVFNRRMLNTSLQHSLDNAKTENVTPAIMMIDVDEFKLVNDRFGHGVGDDVIKAVATLIDDYTDENGKVFRVGGEEFVLLLEQGHSDLLSHADGLRAKIQAAPIIAEQAITVSIGLCSLDEHKTTEQWLRCADRALYKAKELGKNRVVADTEAAA